MKKRVAPNGEEFPHTYTVGAAVARFGAKAFFRVRYVGLENVPADGPAILTPNHVSFIDPFLVAGVIPRPMVFIAHEMFFNKEPLGRWMRNAGGLPVNPDGESAGSMREVLRALKSGRLLGMFPEGTRSWDGQVLPPMPGVGLLVSATDAPVIPINVDGAHAAWPRHRRLPVPRQITVRFGTPVDLSDLRARMSTDRKHRRELQQEIATRVVEAIAALAPGQPTPAT